MHLKDVLNRFPIKCQVLFEVQFIFIHLLVHTPMETIEFY